MPLTDLLSIDPFAWSEILAAVLCGFLIGLERQLRGKPVGIRTSSLIVIGTYVFVSVSATLTSNAVDATRVVGQVITGIGFLGAGVILTRDGVVVGVTSAAIIWMLAAIGVCIAIVSPIVGIKLSLLIVAILYGVEFLESIFHALRRGVHARFIARGEGKVTVPGE